MVPGWKWLDYLRNNNVKQNSAHHSKWSWAEFFIRKTHFKVRTHFNVYLALHFAFPAIKVEIPNVLIVIAEQIVG